MRQHEKAGLEHIYSDCGRFITLLCLLTLWLTLGEAGLDHSWTLEISLCLLYSSTTQTSAIFYMQIMYKNNSL